MRHIKRFSNVRINSVQDVLNEMGRVNIIVREITEQNIRHGLDEFKRDVQKKKEAPHTGTK